MRTKGLCLPVSRFIFGRNEFVEDDSDRVIRDFYLTYFGAHGVDETRSVTAHNLILEQLTTESASKLSVSEGLVRSLQPYLADLLMRHQDFRGIVDTLQAAVDADNRLPRAAGEVSAKELFVALLLSTRVTNHPRLASVYARLHAPLPVGFTTVARPGSDCRAAAFFSMLREVCAVPQTDRRVVVSLGTQLTANCGKTSLLGALGLTVAAEENLDFRPSGPLHAPSCDLLGFETETWVLDVHGVWTACEEELRLGILALALWSSALCIVQCSLGDFSSKTNALSRDLQAVLESITRTAVNMTCSAAVARCAGFVVVLRDTSADALAQRSHVVEAALRPYGPLAVIPVEDCRGFRSGPRRAGVIERIKTKVEDCLAADRGVTMPCFEELLCVHKAVVEGRFVQRPQALHKGPMNPSRLGHEFLAHLQSALGTGKTATTLFPLSAISRRLAALTQQAQTGGGKQPPRTPARAHTRMEQLQQEESMARTRATEMGKLNKELETVRCSQAMKLFLQIVSRGDLAAFVEVSRYLESWKEPQVLPLLERQRDLLDQQGSPGLAGQNASETSKEALELEKIAAQLAELDFSMQSFWLELELLAKREARAVKEQPGAATDASKPTADVYSLAQQCWQAQLAEGHPFQVLHSRPLQMAGSFLRQTLASIGASRQDPRGIYVVSVIGAQSSAKSTLLNFLFGCDFATNAGRCTRGLYASYLEPSSGPPILVLDSEGLLSLGSEGSVFDGQIALMCMACSHLVLVNQKGELSRQLQDLIEVCLFAMRHLRLMRQQPRIAFVLRDQHDRSRTVHEDMLKQMRRHLEETAQTLGSSLEDLILLDGTAIFLMPSAFTSELRQGREVSWTGELFAREILRLRNTCMKWLNEDAAIRAKKAGGAPPEFSTLTQWYDYSSSVWDTLVQFGEQLLHYKTIHEIELRRELADVAKTAVRETLDGCEHQDSKESGMSTGLDGATLGFHARARYMVDSYTQRMFANLARLDLETTDMEFNRALMGLRDDSMQQLEVLFRDRTADPRFSAAAKEEARQQMRTPIEWAFENHLYTWKLHLKKASDERAMHALWSHFTGVLNKHLAQQGHRFTMSDEDAQTLFETEWRAYEAAFVTRLRSLTKDWCNLAHEVTMLFNHAVAKLHHEVGTLALLKEIGSQQVGMPPDQRRDAGMLCITEQTDEDWEEQYFHLGWWSDVTRKTFALFQTAGGTDTGRNRSLRNLIPRMRQAVSAGLQSFGTEVRQRGALDEATAADGLRHITGVVFQDIEARLLQELSVTLKRPQVLHALHVGLRLACVEALVAVEADKQAKAMADLLAEKTRVEEHFLLIVKDNKGDVERATNFATLYHHMLNGWMDHEVMRLAADVRNQVLQEMPNPQKSSDRAFQQSFTAKNWQDILEYVLDENAYLEKTFLLLFHQRKRPLVGAGRSRLEKRVRATYCVLQDLARQWAREGKSDLPKLELDVTKPPAGEHRSVREFKDFVVLHADRGPAGGESAESHRQLADRLPQTANFSISDPKLFADTFQARVGDIIDSSEIGARLQEKLSKALREQSMQAWQSIRGCSERCPLCGSKCDIVGEHSRHHCSHHLFPAFHGWMDRDTGLPSFNHCSGAETHEGTYECKDGVWRKLEEYLHQDHSAWMPFNLDVVAAERDVKLLQAAWVNCREPLLEYFAPMTDCCPEEWRHAYYDEGAALTRNNLQVAKDTIRRLRDRTWIPPEM